MRRDFGARNMLAPPGQVVVERPGLVVRRTACNLSHHRPAHGIVGRGFDWPLRAFRPTVCRSLADYEGRHQENILLCGSRIEVMHTTSAQCNHDSWCYEGRATAW